MAAAALCSLCFATWRPPPPKWRFACCRSDTGVAGGSAVGRRPRSHRGAANGLGAGEAPAVRPRRLALTGGESGRPTALLGGSDTESFSPSTETASDRLDPYSGGGGSSSSSSSEADLARTAAKEEGAGSGPGWNQPSRPGDPHSDSPGKGKALRESSCPADGEAASPQQPPALYVQLHGETARRLESHEKPLQIQNDYLSQLGFRDLWRVQEVGMDSETGCLSSVSMQNLCQVIGELHSSRLFLTFLLWGPAGERQKPRHQAGAEGQLRVGAPDRRHWQRPAQL
ncbi:PH domain leucine-rich repeat-containing protein phosphatase 1-like [Erythrolamprus reginae]|uniref:PH domain leucine-rich repeat-containing protein phosphatase 1-like n=1 Tax=Erythrolamprus reginae TaxID=121349 RepID=UPI00396C311D